MIPAIIACKVNRNANADIQEECPAHGCTGAVWALLPSMARADKPRDFFRQFSAESAPQIRYYAESAAVMRGVCKMCTIQTGRRAPIVRQTQISKTAPMNPAIR